MVLPPHTTDGYKPSIARTIIGNDVWIGMGVNILHGISIGDGAVIGAGSVITKDIPPYAVVVGNPGRVIKFRFEEEIIALLLQLKWWDWDEDKIRRNIEFLRNEPTMDSLITILQN